MVQVSAKQAAEAITAFAEALPGPYGYESSIKFIGDQVYVDRFLVTFPKMALELGADLSGLLQKLSFPGAANIEQMANRKTAWKKEWQELLDEGDMVHLGFEAESNSFMCKLYVESTQRTRALWQSDDLPDLKPVPVHRALKWRQAAGGCYRTAYDWLPCSSESQLTAQIEALCGGLNKKILDDLVALAAGRAPIGDLQLLRVSEPASHRQSFDLNFYDAQLRVADVVPLFERLFIAPVLGLHILTHNEIKDQLLGHVAAGVSRENQPFLTVYYGGGERGGFS